MKRLVLAAVAISLALAPGIGAAAGPCGVGCTIEVRDDAIVGSARETEVRVGVPVLWRLTGSREHVIASEQHLFRSPLLGRAVGDAVYWRRHFSAGYYVYYDARGKARGGAIAALPLIEQVAEGRFRAIWATPLTNTGNAFAARWYLLRNDAIRASGTWYARTGVRSRTVARGERLAPGAVLVRGDSLCVEARSGLDGRWSEWANTCRVI